MMASQGRLFNESLSSWKSFSRKSAHGASPRIYQRPTMDPQLAF